MWYIGCNAAETPASPARRDGLASPCNLDPEDRYENYHAMDRIPARFFEEYLRSFPPRDVTAGSPRTHWNNLFATHTSLEHLLQEQQQITAVWTCKTDSENGRGLLIRMQDGRVVLVKRTKNQLSAHTDEATLRSMTIPR